MVKYLHRQGGVLVFHNSESLFLSHSGEDSSTTLCPCDMNDSGWGCQTGSGQVRFQGAIPQKNAAFVLFFSLKDYWAACESLVTHGDELLNNDRNKGCALTRLDCCEIALPVFYERREEPAGEPESVSHCQHPQDGQLIQHLANETERHVEVCWKEPCKKRELSFLMWNNSCFDYTISLLV